MKKNYRLIGYRTMAGLCQKDIAKAIGIKESTYAAKETGRGVFKEKEMLKIYQLLKEHLVDVKPDLKITDIFFNQN